MDAPSQPLPAFPFRRQSPFDPPPQYAAARAAGAVFPVTLWNGKRAWLVTRHEEVRAVLADDRRFSGAMAHPDFPSPKCGGSMRFDDFPESYFIFLHARP